MGEDLMVIEIGDEVVVRRRGPRSVSQDVTTPLVTTAPRPEQLTRVGEATTMHLRSTKACPCGAVAGRIHASHLSP